MAQFDLHRPGTGPLVVDLQTDLIGLDATRIVAPLPERGRYAAFPKLTPEVQFEGRDWIVRVPELAAVTSGELGPPVGQIVEAEDDLLRAIDILTRGF